MVKMRYELNNGWTEIMFARKKGEGLIPFPSDNARLVKEQGTRLSQTHLKEKIGKKRYDAL